MATYKELSDDMHELLQLDPSIIACKRMAKKDGYMDIPGIEKPHTGFTYCQLPYFVRKEGKTIGVTKEDFAAYADKTQLKYRCIRIQGLAHPEEAHLDSEANALSGFWFNDYETARKHMDAYPKVSPIEALVMSPLEEEKFEPDYLLIYANGAQMTLLMNGLQYYDYEPIESSFIGEGSCADALPRCSITGKPSLCLPCVGERIFGLVGNDELVIAIPADRLDQTVKGLKALKESGYSYPPTASEPGMNALEWLGQVFPVQE